MNIKYIDGNIFNSKLQTVVNTVNCVGVMGKGIALVFRLRYPKMFEEYKKLCRSKESTLHYRHRNGVAFIKFVQTGVIRTGRSVLCGSDRYKTKRERSRICVPLCRQKKR